METTHLCLLLVNERYKYTELCAEEQAVEAKDQNTVNSLKSRTA